MQDVETVAIYRTATGTSFQVTGEVSEIQFQVDVSPNGEYAVINDAVVNHMGIAPEMYRLADGTKIPYGDYRGKWDSTITPVFLALVAHADNTVYDLKAYHPATNTYDDPLVSAVDWGLSQSPDRQSF